MCQLQLSALHSALLVQQSRRLRKLCSCQRRRHVCVAPANVVQRHHPADAAGVAVGGDDAALVRVRRCQRFPLLLL